MAAGRINSVGDPLRIQRMTDNDIDQGDQRTDQVDQDTDPVGQILWSICVNIVLLQFIKNIETITINHSFKVEIN